MKISILSGLSLLLTMFTCAKDQDEVYTDEEEAYREAHFGKKEVSADAATADWNQFMKDARTAILISKKNLVELEIMASKVTGREFDELYQLHDISKAKLKNAEEELSKRNKEFLKEAKDYNQEVYRRNEAFKKQFKRDLSDINIEIEEKLE